MIQKRIDIRGQGSQDYAGLDTYFLDFSTQIDIDQRPVVIICPGGGYEFTSDREAEIVAMQFVAMGYHAAVLRYSVSPSVYPAAMLELGRSVRVLRENVEKWHIDRNQIFLLGFSAGGHLVADYCMSWNKPEILDKLCEQPQNLQPNGMILGYPVVTAGEYAHQGSIRNLLGERYGNEEDREKVSLEKQVTDAVPRSFIWHTCEDPSVPVQNSYLLVGALLEHHIPVEYHVFEKGGHGLSLANRLTRSSTGFGEEVNCQCWIELVHRWIQASPGSC